MECPDDAPPLKIKLILLNETASKNQHSKTLVVFGISVWLVALVVVSYNCFENELSEFGSSVSKTVGVSLDSETGESLLTAIRHTKIKSEIDDQGLQGPDSCQSRTDKSCSVSSNDDNTNEQVKTTETINHSINQPKSSVQGVEQSDKLSNTVTGEIETNNEPSGIEISVLEQNKEITVENPEKLNYELIKTVAQNKVEENLNFNNQLIQKIDTVDQSAQIKELKPDMEFNVQLDISEPNDKPNASKSIATGNTIGNDDQTKRKQEMSPYPTNEPIKTHDLDFRRILISDEQNTTDPLKPLKQIIKSEEIKTPELLKSPQQPATSEPKTPENLEPTKTPVLTMTPIPTTSEQSEPIKATEMLKIPVSINNFEPIKTVKSLESSKPSIFSKPIESNPKIQHNEEINRFSQIESIEQLSTLIPITTTDKAEGPTYSKTTQGSQSPVNSATPQINDENSYQLPEQNQEVVGNISSSDFKLEPNLVQNISVLNASVEFNGKNANYISNKTEQTTDTSISEISNTSEAILNTIETNLNVPPISNSVNESLSSKSSNETKNANATSDQDSPTSILPPVSAQFGVEHEKIANPTGAIVDHNHAVSYNSGEIRSVSKAHCVDSGSHEGSPLSIFSCHGLGGNQKWIFSLQNEIRKEQLCADYFGGPSVLLFNCHGNMGNQRWNYDTQNQTFHHPNSNTCLTLLENVTVGMRPCDDEADSQKWIWRDRVETVDPGPEVTKY